MASQRATTRYSLAGAAPVVADPVADPVKYSPWTIGQNMTEIKAMKMKNEKYRSPWQDTMLQTYGYNLANEKILEKVGKESGLVKVRNVIGDVEADFFGMTRFSAKLNGVDGSIIQVVSIKLTTTDNQGKPTTNHLKPYVEGWVVGANGNAAGNDFHGTSKTLDLDPTKNKSISMSATFEVGVGLYDNGKITGRRGGMGSVPGVYDIFPNGDPTKVKWLGDQTKNTTYTVTFTFNADGTWVWKDPSAGIDLSGKFGDIEKK